MKISMSEEELAELLDIVRDARWWGCNFRIEIPFDRCYAVVTHGGNVRLDDQLDGYLFLTPDNLRTIDFHLGSVGVVSVGDVSVEFTRTGMYLWLS